MPTEKQKILLIVDGQLLERIDDFRFGNRINTRSEAIRLSVALLASPCFAGEYTVESMVPDVVLNQA